MGTHTMYEFQLIVSIPVGNIFSFNRGPSQMVFLIFISVLHIVWVYVLAVNHN